MFIIQQHHSVHCADGKFSVVLGPGHACHLGSSILQRERVSVATELLDNAQSISGLISRVTDVTGMALLYILLVTALSSE